MKQKFMKIILTLCMLSSLASADDGSETMYGFVGVQASASKYDDISTPTLALKYGQQSSYWRTAISYNFAANSDDQFHSIIAQVDHGILTEIFADLPVKPYVGFSIGALQHRNSNNEVDSDNGYLYGLNTGINYVVNNDLDIDLGYRYIKSSKLKYLDSVSNLSLSLHYYFN
ncbi:MAG: porin family protein [Epsilonproteobacteria bacterium]|nr:porin family protein [Campylobacterota bacterium]